jgi:hypothetical protein
MEWNLGASWFPFYSLALTGWAFCLKKNGTELILKANEIESTSGWFQDS